MTSWDYPLKTTWNTCCIKNHCKLESENSKEGKREEESELVPHKKHKRNSDDLIDIAQPKDAELHCKEDKLIETRLI